MALGGARQTAANTDVDALRLWLAEYAGLPHTLRNYRKEAVRLIVWATRLGKALSSLNREDLLVPMNPSWPILREIGLIQPFRAEVVVGVSWMVPSPRSVRQAMGILSGLFGYLVAAGYPR